MRNRLNAGRCLGWLGAAAVVAAFAFAEPSVVAPKADPVVDRMCKRDWKRLCGHYPARSAQTRKCMEAKRRSLSSGCVQALANAGMIPKRYLRRR